MSIEVKKGGSCKPPKIRIPVQDCDVSTLNLVLNHVCKTDLIFPWSWDFEAYFKLVIPLPTQRTIVKEKALNEFLQTVHPDDREGLTNELKHLADHKKNKLDYPFRSNYLSVDPKWYKITGEVVIDGESGSCKAIGIIQDIHKRTNERKESEELLAKAQKKIEVAITDRNLALDNLNTALVYVNRNYVVRWNSIEIMKRIMGESAYSKGTLCYESTFGREEPCDDCPVQRMFESRKTEMKRFEMHGETIEATVNPIYKEGELAGGILKLDKITDRVKHEHTIEKLNVLMGAILNNIPVSLFVKDPNDHFKYLYWNVALAAATQIPASQVIGRTDEDIFRNKEEADRFKKNDYHVLETEGTVSFIEEYTTPDGEPVIVNSLKTVIPGGKGKLPWILGISWDITDIKIAEKELIRLKDKAEESNRLKSSFLANMSHEIRTPLNAIVGFSELLCEIEDVEEKTDYISIIKRNNNLLLQLISDILDLSKIEAESLDFVYSMVDVHKLVGQVVAANDIQDNTAVPVILDQYIPGCYINTDKNRLNQVLFNLINNALKFTPRGEIRVGYHPVSTDHVRFYVKDTGVGIEASKLHTIFERFIKLDSFKQGSGLGLSISKSIIEQLGGTIGVESEPGKGSCFWFVLPYNKG